MNFGIIAAGEGSRLANEGVTTPKPLIEIGGMPMLGRLVDIFQQCGADTVSVIINDRMPAVRDYADELVRRYANLRLIVKSTPSSMHSFYELSRGLDDGRIVLTTVDTIFRLDDFRRYVAAYEAATDINGLMAVTTYIDDESPLYVDVDERSMRIRAFCDKPFDGVKYISGGIYGLDHRAVSLLGRCVDSGMQRMRNFQRQLIADGLDIRAYDLGKIVDVDHPGDIATARDFIERIEDRQ